MSITNILAWLNVLAGWSKGYFNFQTCKILHVGWSMEQRILLEKLPNHKSAWNNFPCSQNFELSKDRVILQAPSDWSLKSPARIHSPYKFFYLVPNLTSLSLPWPTTNIPRPMNPALHACSANALLPLDLRPRFRVGRGLHRHLGPFRCSLEGLLLHPASLANRSRLGHISFKCSIWNLDPQ